MRTDELVVKFPSDDLRLGTQLVVHPGQTAIFMKGGVICDEFTSGTYQLETKNIPILNKLINLPFGGDSPFQAEVWFINNVSILDSKWGTTTPLQIEDPKYDVIVPVRSYGQYGFRITQPRLFLEKLSGNMPSFSTEKLKIYFRGKILSQLTNIISDKLIRDKISILNINAHLVDISEYALERLKGFFSEYGLALEVFDIIAISVKEDDPSFLKLKEAKDLAAKLKITGRDAYQMQRSFDVLESAAMNDGVAGGMIGAGMGVGAGFAAGGQMASLASNINTNPSPLTPPPLTQPSVQYFVAVNGQQQGPYDFNSVVLAIQEKSLTPETLVWKAGMASWAKLETLAEFSHLFTVPPPIPNI